MGCNLQAAGLRHQKWAARANELLNVLHCNGDSCRKDLWCPVLYQDVVFYSDSNACKRAIAPRVVRNVQARLKRHDHSWHKGPIMVHSAGVMGVQPQPVTCTQQGVAESAVPCAECNLARMEYGRTPWSELFACKHCRSIPILMGAEEASAYGRAGLTQLLRGSSCPHIPTE